MLYLTNTDCTECPNCGAELDLTMLEPEGYEGRSVICPFCEEEAELEEECDSLDY